MGALFANSKPIVKEDVCYKRVAASKIVRYKKSMANNLKTLRKAKGLTQEQLSDMAGMSKSYYSQLEGGSRRINSQTLERLAKALGVEAFMVVVNPDDPDESGFAESYSVLDRDERQIIWDLSRTLSAKSAQENESDA